MKQQLLGVDQLINTVVFDTASGKVVWGFADESLSARAYRLRNSSWWWRWFYVTVNKIFFWQENHCLEAFVSEYKRKHLPAIYRDMLPSSFH